MKMTPAPVAGLATENHTLPARTGRNALQDGRSQRTRPLMRKFEIVHLNSSGDIEDLSRLAPATPAFEDAFAAFGRGALLQTDNGPCAIEDLLPGDRVMTSDAGLQTLLWKGSITIVPGAQNMRPEMGTMTRVTSDAMGYGRPSPDLVLGPSARILHKAPTVRTLTGSDAAFVPMRDFIDEARVIELRPAAPVEAYQLGFEEHHKVSVNGIEVESLHPGPAHTLALRQDMIQLLLSLFPHKVMFSDFGSMLHPRIRLRDLDLLETVEADAQTII